MKYKLEIGNQFGFFDTSKGKKNDFWGIGLIFLSRF